MEYRRSRSRGRQRTGTGSGGRAFLFIVILAAAVYFVSISAVGSWIAQNVVEPVFSAFSTKKEGGSDSAHDIYRVNDVAQLDLPRLKCYALQMGVFSTIDRAEAEAENIKKQGGGGYIFSDGDKFRVLASAYGTEDDARSVKERLRALGEDCSIHELTTEAMSYDVNVIAGTTSTAKELEKVLLAILSAHDDLLELEGNFDAETMTAAQGAKAAESIYTQLSSATTDRNSLPQAVGECYESGVNALKELSQAHSLSPTEFAAKLKYTQLQIACEFTKMVEGMINNV